MAKNKNSSYYDQGGLSDLDIWKAKLTKEEFRGLCKGNVLKYVLRAGSKKGQKTTKDLRKAKDYLDFWIESFGEEEKDENS